MAIIEDQQFCLRWNNFQANFTSQFETLRDDEDFTDVTIACEGQKLQGHKVVLSACSPYFKELFKANPCSHPIIFMRDVEARHMVALMEFMYAGEVNVAQAHLSNFLKTAESLRIRGLTDTSENDSSKEENTLYLNPQSSRNSNKYPKFNKIRISSTSTVTSSQDIPIINETLPVPNTLSKRACKLDSEGFTLRPLLEDSLTVNPFAIQEEINENTLQPKIELPDYISDEEARDENGLYATALSGGIEIIPHASTLSLKEPVNDSYQNPIRLRRRCSSNNWYSQKYGETSSDFHSRFHRDSDKRNKLVKIADGIEVYEDQLRSVKWSDYRKLTRGLATILFSPSELASCSVTGQRWSRAGNGERPVKPALDRAKVQAIISYVATRFPMVEISRIKQVLAYKCKENSTAFKMKGLSEQHLQ